MPAAPLLKEKEEGKARVLEEGVPIVGLLPEERDPRFRGEAGKLLEGQGALVRTGKSPPSLLVGEADEIGAEGGVAALSLPMLVNGGIHDLVIGRERGLLPFLD